MTKGHKAGDVLARLDFDPYYRSFRNSSTHVLAPKLDEAAIRAALKAGPRVSWPTTGCATPPGSASRRVDAGGKQAAIMGDEVKLADGLKLTAKLPLPAYVRLLATRQGGREVRGQGRVRVRREGSRGLPTRSLAQARRRIAAVDFREPDLCEVRSPCLWAAESRTRSFMIAPMANNQGRPATKCGMSPIASAASYRLLPRWNRPILNRSGLSRAGLTGSTH